MPKRTNIFIPEPGTFCKVTVVIPSDVSAASYSRPSSRQSGGLADSVLPESRLCYVRDRLAKTTTFAVHFCTAFGGKDIMTQFEDDPEKRNRFLALAPTPSHNEHAALTTVNGWNRTSAYICLYPAIHVTMSKTRTASHPVATVPNEERARLDDLIETFAMIDSIGAGESEDEEEDKEENHQSQDDDKRPLPSTEAQWVIDFSSAASGSSRPAPNYSRSSSVQRWAYEVAGLDFDSFHQGDAAASRDDDNWSEVSDFGSHDLVAARMNRIKKAQVIFSDDLDNVIMTEEDPAGMFLREACYFGSITVV
ncbi:hypothetical protein DFS34DRAFT_646545 [Phlyctochytrium arcticum]|nr:hypothetical protein DFS34DRAFT_646545 [Phlyctochytrium arcticum]